MENPPSKVADFSFCCAISILPKISRSAKTQIGFSFSVLNFGSCYKLSKCTKWHSIWSKLSFWVKIVVILLVAQLVTTVIFFSAWVKSHVKWDNSRISTQKMSTIKKIEKLFTWAQKRQSTSVISWTSPIFSVENWSHPPHTVILPDWTLEKWALSSYTFRSL